MRRPLVLLVTAALLVAGCSGDAGAPDRSASPSTTAPAPDRTAGGLAADPSSGDLSDVPAIVADVGPSVVSIRFERGEGSGVIYAADGVVVTNAHVVEAAAGAPIQVTLANGERLAAEPIATDPVTDLALVRIDADGLPAARFAERLPTVGELAVALGNPLGFENSATAGIVSGLDRTLPTQASGSTLVGLIQTDAPISPGNSGGALVDASGQVIGINVAKLPANLNAANVGFAIPATTVVPVVEQLLEQGTVHHPYLGIRGATLTPQVAERFGIDRDQGVVVAEVTPGGPAAEAGLESGDVIVGLEGGDVGGFGDLVVGLRRHAPGDTVEVTVARDGQELTLDVTLGERPR